jgi:hypothetical protein
VTSDLIRRPHRRLRLIAALAVAALVLTACAAGPNAAIGPDAAGFWLGLWHGLISPITFLVSLFTDKVSIYEVHNNGNWYDFGFMLGISAVFSGPASSRGAVARRRGRQEA